MASAKEKVRPAGSASPTARPVAVPEPRLLASTVKVTVSPSFGVASSTVLVRATSTVTPVPAKSTVVSSPGVTLTWTLEGSKTPPWSGGMART